MTRKIKYPKGTARETFETSSTGSASRKIQPEEDVINVEVDGEPSRPHRRGGNAEEIYAIANALNSGANRDSAISGPNLAAYIGTFLAVLVGVITLSYKFGSIHEQVAAVSQDIKTLREKLDTVSVESVRVNTKIDSIEKIVDRLETKEKIP